MTRYRTVARCVEPGCRCLDTAGIILYDGPDAVAATEAESMAPAAYACEVEELPAGEPAACGRKIS